MSDSNAVPPDLPSRATSALRAEFPGTADRIYLNTAAEGCGSRTMEGSFLRYAAAKRRGAEGRADLSATEAAAKTCLADWLGCASADLAFLGSTTEAINVVLNGLPWRAGDNVVISDLEFPSAMAGCLALAQRSGVAVRVVPHAGGDLNPATVIDEIDDRTRLVILSHVSYFSGARLDVATVAGAAHGRGALILVDASQSLGAVPVSVAGIDFLVACTFKWLVASHGLAMLYVDPRRLDALPNQPVGWRGVTDLLSVVPARSYDLHPDARRFEPGMPSYPAIYTLHDALEYLVAIGPAWITTRVLAHSAALLETGAGCHLRALTPSAAERRAGIVAFAHPAASAIGAALAARNVIAWCRDGRVRFSAHFYTSDDDLRALDRILPEALAAVARDAASVT